MYNLHITKVYDPLYFATHPMKFLESDVKIMLLELQHITINKYPVYQSTEMTVNMLETNSISVSHLSDGGLDFMLATKHA